MTDAEVLQLFQDAGCQCPEGWDYTKWYASPIPIELGNWEYVARVYFPKDSTLAVGNSHGYGGTTFSQVIINPNGMTIDGLAPDAWLARQETRSRKLREFAAQYVKEHPLVPFVTEADLSGVTVFQDLLARMQDARAKDAADFDEYEHTGTPYADEVLAQAVLYLALRDENDALVQQAKELIKLYRAVEEDP